MANGRKTNNFIMTFKSSDDIITDQQGKERVFHRAYYELTGSSQARQPSLHLSFLELIECDLEDHHVMFLEEEAWNAIKELPSNRAPGLEGFIDHFYHKAWSVIKGDIMASLHNFFLSRTRGVFAN